jgi:uncharacterized zinc-type alcohol dehydrogenase-like protein
VTQTLSFAAQSAHHRLSRFNIERKEPAPNEIQIDILYCGVCHTDIHFARNEWNNTIYPCVPGHEIIGRVQKIGTEVKKFKVGDNVGVGCMVDACLTCAHCTEGLEQYCDNGFTGTYNGRIKNAQPPAHTLGGYSNLIVVREEFVLKIPDGLDLSRAAPLLCAGITSYSPLRHWKVKAGDTVGIIGIGGLGSMAAKLAHAMGAHVSLITRTPHKAEEAQRLNARLLVSTDHAAMTKHANHFDFLLNTIPQEHEINPYISLLKTDGVMVVVGCLTQVKTPLMTGDMVLKRKTIAGSLIGGIAQTQELMDFCAKHHILPDVEMIQMDYINEAYERMIKSDVKYRFVIDMKSLKV